jgi:hypothetical protein
MKNIFKCIQLISLSVFSIVALSQDPVKFSVKKIQIHFIQIKEGLNFGLVFSGPQFSYNQDWIWEKENSEWQMGTKIGAGILFSHEIPGICATFIPLEFKYYRKIAGIPLQLGFYASPEYRYQLYPDLQSGFDYWLSILSIGPSLKYQQAFSNIHLDAELNTSLFGFTSRPDDYRDPYFYDLGFTYAVKHLNSEFQSGSLGTFNRTKLTVAISSKKIPQLRIAYQFEYLGYYQEPRYSITGHGISIIFKPKYPKSHV